MKICFWIFVTLFAVNQKTSLAKVYGEPNLLDSNEYTGERMSRIEFANQLHKLALHCIDDVKLLHMSPELQREKGICVFDCVGTKLNIIDENKNFNEIGFWTFIKHELILEDHHKAIVDETVVNCIQHINMLPNNGLDETSGCSRIPAEALICVDKAFKRASHARRFSNHFA
ncbi:uncharacterized protein LOC116337161 [Contarinia nasturtii]|uniref:uncharacterized protein LOC116337161 n=1 Tax=Contarinia nasturtii TaxID=265458 RepID=UPI0012D3CE99|nr:uncharacterized protein LOC116337161 [Contarinia nasturtii]